MPYVNLFIYGTLRDWNNGLARAYFSEREFDTRRPATMPGRLYSTGAFPVMVDHDEYDNGDVVGEVITVGPDLRDYRDLLRMEVSAGYYVDSRLARLDNGDLVRCQVFLCEPSMVSYHWPPVPGDDWHRADELPPIRNSTRLV